MKRKNKQKRLPLADDKLESPSEEIIQDLKTRIYHLTGLIEEENIDDKIILKTRNMTFATLEPEDDYVKVTCNLPYERILDMSRKCEVQPYSAEDKTDIVTYKVKTRFDVQYAVSIVQQSFIYRKRLKL
ncbi:MAG: hypothetical protein BZ135_01510 [Methanosphaera sp. rholeuAM6]|nr:MAG: hypothetical protein BZ135_01510 [Methanosphaera sp. rholeuAM6]